MALIAHLRGDFGFRSAPRELPGFIDRPGQRLLHVDVFAERHGGESDVRVHVIGSGDEDGVDVLLMLEHVAIVLIAFGFRQMLVFQADHSVETGFGFDAIEFDGRLSRGGLRIGLIEALLQIRDFCVETVEGVAGVAPVHVAERHDILAGKIDQIGAAHAADADSGDIQQVAGRSKTATEDVSWHNGEAGGACGDVGQKLAARDFFLFAHIFSL